MEGIKPGSIILIDGKVPPSMTVTAGATFLFADETSFTVMTSEGFPDAEWNMFSTFGEDGVAYAQVRRAGWRYRTPDTLRTIQQALVVELQPNSSDRLFGASH